MKLVPLSIISRPKGGGSFVDSYCKSGADPGLLERGFLCTKVWGFALLILSYFSTISNENEISCLTETKLFYFI